jgi:hypothetical protein
MRKIALFLAFLSATSLSHAFVVFDLAAQVMGVMTDKQLNLLNASELEQLTQLKNQLESMKQQYDKLSDINDELNSAKTNWGKIATTVFGELEQIEGLSWLTESGIYDVFGGMSSSDINRLISNPTQSLKKMVLKNAPFDVDEDDMLGTWGNAMEWVSGIMSDENATAQARSGAVLKMSDILAAKYHSETEVALKTIGALVAVSNNLSEEIDENTNMGDNMVAMNKQSAVTNNLMAEQIRQERAANEVLITNAQAETEILRMQERREQERARVEALRQ